MIGLVLTQMGPLRHGAIERATLVATQYGMCTGRGCSPVPLPVYGLIGYGTGTSTNADGTQLTIPAGDYGLYLVTDGQSVTIRLRLHNLHGDRDVQPHGPANISLFEATPDPSGRHFTTDGNVHFAGLGMITQAAITRSKVQSFPQGGFCIVGGHNSRHPEDPVDPITGCTSRLPRSEINRQLGKDPGNFHGSNAQRGTTLGGDYPGGTVEVLASFDAGDYRYGQDWLINPSETQHAFVGLAIGWQF